MKIYQIITLSFLLICVSCSPENKSNYPFNLDFEKMSGSKIPDYWVKWGQTTYETRGDTMQVYSGNRSALIRAREDSKDQEFGSMAFKIPANYEADQITLNGYMKFENVENGFVGLMLRLDGAVGSRSFDNMQNKNIHGTKNWEKYTITLPYSDETTQIWVGMLLTGSGTAWFDKFEVLLDGEDIKKIKPKKKEKEKAELDVAFSNGTDIKALQLTNLQEESLYKMGKVWGFVKYNHPEIAKANINWDNEAFRLLPSLLNASDNNSANAEITMWLKKSELDKVETREKSELTTSKNVKLREENSWILDTNELGSELSELLVRIGNAKKEDKHFYLGFTHGVGNPIFRNENPYENMNSEDDGLKLLALFRFWNMVEYYFPNRHLMDENWDNVLGEFIPKIVKSDTELSYKLALIELISKVQDTHANVWGSYEVLDDFFGTMHPPFLVNILEKKVIVTKVLSESDLGIKVGDIILEVDDRPVWDLINEKIKYCPASNLPTQYRDVSKRILRTNNDEITLIVQGNVGKSVIIVETEDWRSVMYRKSDIISHKMLDGNIGYIYPGTLEQGEIDEIMDKFMDTKGIVVDLRCYPSDFIVFSLNKYLMPEPTEFVKFSIGSLSNPGEFTFGEPLKAGTENTGYYKGKVVILINETTQSQAEYTTMALRASPNAIVIGSTTAGADGNVSQIILPGNVRTMISGIGVYYPDGTETQRVGIIPDIELRPTIEGVRLERDELLEMAIEIINK